MLFAAGIALALFLGMLAFLEMGRRFGIRQTAKHGTAARSGVGVVDSAVYAVLALLLGFIFSGATSRYDHRRELVATQASTIGTAWQRIGALPAETQPRIRADFRRYVDAILASYASPKPPRSDEAVRERAAIVRLQDDLWNNSLAACLAPDGEKARMLLLPSLNEMFDAIDRERLARLIHPPKVIWLMLFVAAMSAALFAGYSMSSGPTRNWMYIVGTAATISIVTYVIIEIEYPRLGAVRVDEYDRVLVETRQGLR
jgi:hypothetical protein